MSIPHQITLEQAIQMTTSYRSAKPDGMPNAETFTKESVLTLLQQPDCVSFRIYYGRKEDNTIHAILVGVNTVGEDILSIMNEEETEGIILEEGQRCPPICGAISLLNS